MSLLGVGMVDKDGGIVLWPCGVEGDGGIFASLFERYAPGWAKVCALVDLFSMSLEQILDGWTAGGLRAAFTSDEVVHFISIVFEESALRTDKVTAILATDPAMAAAT